MYQHIYIAVQWKDQLSPRGLWDKNLSMCTENQ